MRRYQQAFITVTCALFVLGLSGKTSAETKLRWKHKAGEKMQYTMTQTMNMEMSLGGRDVKNQVEQELEMVNTTLEVDDQGVATIRQEIRRLVMTMQLPGGQKVKIDSAAEEEPEDEISKAMLPLIKKLTGAKFTFKMAPTGKISDLEAPDDLFKGDKTPVGQMFSKMFTKDSLNQIITQGSPVFPEKALEVGDKWQQNYGLKNPIGLQQSVDNTFTYLGPGEGDDASLHKIGLELLMEFVGAEEDGPKVEIANQDSRGAIFFDAAAGRLVRSSIDQSMDMKIAVGGFEADQKIRNQMSVKVTPLESDP